MLHQIGCRRITSLKRQARHLALSAVLGGSGLATAHAQRQLPISNATIDVTTYAYDNGRTGLNGQEALLTPRTVNPFAFGRLFTLPTDGYVYAQPLYLRKLTIPGQGVHNVVFVATEHDSVYAYDADKPGAPLWQVSFLNSSNPGTSVSTVSSGQVGTGDIVPEIGITGTPVIDPATGTLYVVAKTAETTLGVTTFVQRLHALDVHTGAEKPNSPVVIQGSVPGNGDGSVSGTVTFNPLRQNQRSALLLANGVVYIAWASHGDNVGGEVGNLFPEGYHGWVMGYDAATLNQVSIWNSSPNAATDPSGYPLAAGGIWMAGSGPAADSLGNIYLSTGNGTFDVSGGPSSPAYGDAIVKLTPGLAVQDYFAPFNQDDLNRTDADLGSGGVMLLPDNVTFNKARHVMAQAGKQGKVYLINRDRMGQNNGNDQILGFLSNAVGGVWGKPSYYNNTIYFGGAGDVIKAFNLRAFRSSNYGSLNQFGLPNPFTATPNLGLNGAAKVTSGVLQLTDGKNGEASSAFFTNRVNVSRFETLFLFQATGTKPLGNGITFTLQGNDPGAVGAVDTGLGYAGIDSSVAVKWDLVKHNQWTLKLGVQKTTDTFILSLAGYTRPDGTMAAPIVTAPIPYTTDKNAEAGNIASALNLILPYGSATVVPDPNSATTALASFSITVPDDLPQLQVTPALIGNFGGLTTASNASVTAVNASSTQLYLNGARPLNPAIDLGGADIDLTNGDLFGMILVYNGSWLQVITIDLYTGDESIQQYQVDIPTVVGSKLGFAGFTGSTSGINATLSIPGWFYYGPGLVQKVMVRSDQGAKGFGFPGPVPSISAQFFNGKLTSGIVWAIQADQYGFGGPAILRAFDASNLSNQLYSSGSAGENPSGSAVKFAVPVVANGKVYVGSSNGVTVYGKRVLGFAN